MDLLRWGTSSFDASFISFNTPACQTEEIRYLPHSKRLLDIWLAIITVDMITKNNT